jgi:hypothetical protein
MPRSYIKPRTLAVIRCEVQRIMRDRKAAGQPAPRIAQLSEWLGYSKRAIVAARKAAPNA